MRIPWGTPTVSDSAKLGLVTSQLGRDFSGVRLYQLLLQAIVTEDFANLTAWTEVDSDGDNVAVAGGILSMNGSGSYTTNGISYTAGVARANGMCFEVKCKSINAAVISLFGLNSVDAISPSGSNIPVIRQSAANAFQPIPSNVVLGTAGTTTDAWYTLRIYIGQDTDGDWVVCRQTIQGGTQFVNETSLALIGTYTIPATLYPYLSRYTNDAANLTQFKEFRVYSGYAVDGPTLTYVADAGAGQVFNGLVFANLAAVGSWATTNVTFAYSYDDGVASYSTEKTLAQLNALTALTTTKRYIRLRVTVNSDGATQQYAGELNADDGTAAAFVLPTASTILSGTTINTIAGSFNEAARNYWIAGDASYVKENARLVLCNAEQVCSLPLAGVLTTYGGTFNEASRNTDPGEAYVIAGHNYKICNVTKTASSDKLYSAAEELTRNVSAGASNILSGAHEHIAGVQIDGTSDKLYSAAEEATRNTDPGVAYVNQGTTYKILNVSKTGTMPPATAPTTPVCTTGTQTSTTIPVTIVADASTVNTIYIALEGATSWTAFGTTLTGSGTLTVTGLQAGKRYWYFCRSVLGGSSDSLVMGLIQLPHTDGSTPVYTLITPTTPIYTEV